MKLEEVHSSGRRCGRGRKGTAWIARQRSVDGSSPSGDPVEMCAEEIQRGPVHCTQLRIHRKLFKSNITTRPFE